MKTFTDALLLLALVAIGMSPLLLHAENYYVFGQHTSAVLKWDTGLNQCAGLGIEQHWRGFVFSAEGAVTCYTFRSEFKDMTSGTFVANFQIKRYLWKRK